MAPVAASAPDEKRKKPPTFQHLPEHRAKKLKKLWVEKQKIKSKWKAEKRKEGIVTRRDAAGLAKEEIAEEHEGGSEEDEKQEPRQPVKRKLGEDDATDGEKDSSADSNPASSAREKRRNDSQKDTDEELEKPSLRELQKQAYSRSSLHHFKSDPLHRRGRGGIVNRGGNADRSARGRGKGGGQPDMRLRMSAMLEKIKRDFS